MRFLPPYIFLLAALIAVAAAVRLPNPHELGDYSFKQYVRDFSKSYGVAEYNVRRGYFETNLKAMVAHNAGPSPLYVMNVNRMSDWSPEEFHGRNNLQKTAGTYLRGNLSMRYERIKGIHTYPVEVDYRQTVPPVLTAVKNQGRCGSCWAHSAVQAMESHYAIATGQLHVLSAQQLTSCTPNPRHCGGDGGCKGLVEVLAFEYVKAAGGLAEEWAYPYTSFYGDTGKCRNTTERVVKVDGFVALQENDQGALMDALAFRGPIAVSVDASNWHSYSGGVFDGCQYASNITQNHAVQLVGYGHDFRLKKDYWIVRNSWGVDWGEHGYIRLLREASPKCGWNVDAQSGSACQGDPDTKWVCGMCGILSGATFPIMHTEKLNALQRKTRGM